MEKLFQNLIMFIVNSLAAIVGCYLIVKFTPKYPQGFEEKLKQLEREGGVL